ncbi:MAG: hypothetical protein PHI35_05665, partial [Victivallaceae bacterium]|nr:hypothetical protein [Victivallaceae bacterium]
IARRVGVAFGLLLLCGLSCFLLLSVFSSALISQAATVNTDNSPFEKISAGVEYPALACSPTTSALRGVISRSHNYQEQLRRMQSVAMLPAEFTVAICGISDAGRCNFAPPDGHHVYLCKALPVRAGPVSLTV